MLLKQSTINILDNSGGLLGKCIGIYGKKSVAEVGDFVKLSVKKVRTKLKTARNIKRGDLLRVLVTQARSLSRRTSNFGFSSNQNGGIFVTEDGKPIGTKIKGLVPKELRKKGSLRIAVISAGVI